MPERIQLSRKKDWQMPKNTLSVARPSKWGNPYPVTVYGRDLAIKKYQQMLDKQPWLKERIRKELVGKNLACWCKSEEACHGDILLRIANWEE